MSVSWSQLHCVYDRIPVFRFARILIAFLSPCSRSRYAKIPDDQSGADESGGRTRQPHGVPVDSDLDSDDEREKKLMNLQEQLRQMQEQLNMLVEDCMKNKAKRSKKPVRSSTV